MQSIHSRITLCVTTFACVTAFACAKTTIGPILTTESNLGTTTLGDGDGDSGDGDTGPDEGANAVDILFVIDNSGSMGEEQAGLVNAVLGLLGPLEAANVDYRIAITTSDNGNPWCPAGTTTPEGGGFVLSSCKDRINDFLFNNGAVDVQDLACNDLCDLDEDALEIEPTTTHLDDNPAPRPWVEKIGGQTNLQADTDMADALRCFLPQGINGCGFESQLESMYLGLRRSQNQAESEYGFIRPDAVLAVVFVTDEADCSYNKQFAEIFEDDGDKVFWSDPTAAFPTSAVCWNAGVTCTGDPSNYASCDPVNKDVDGNLNVSDSDAALMPLSRFLDELADLEQDKKLYQGDRENVIALVGGVGGDGQPVYADVSGTDPSFQNSFGIGPGCVAPPLGPGQDPTEAVPPVRIREVVEMGGVGSMYSICDIGGLSDAFADIAETILEEI